MAFVMAVTSSVVMTVSSSAAENKVLSTETVTPGWGWAELGRFEVGDDNPITKADLATYDAVAITVKYTEDILTGVGADTWKTAQAVQVYSQAYGEGYEYNADETLNKSVSGAAVATGKSFSEITADTEYVVTVALSDVLNNLKAVLNDGDTAEDHISVIIVQSGQVQAPITKVELIGQVEITTTNEITISDTIENGTVTAEPTEAAEGDTVTLTATPDEGYVLDKLTVTGASGAVTVTDNKFTMPAEEVTVSATFKAIDYKLTAATADGGSIYFEVDGNIAETANVGDAVYVIIEADDYYNLSSATANGVPVEACLFEMPAENVIVTPVFELDIEELKTDVDAALTSAILEATQSSAYTVANLNTAIVNALAEINEAVALTVDTSALTLKASTEEATGSITGTVTVKAGDTTITTATADVTLEKVPTDPVEIAYEAIVAYLETVTFDNDFHATKQAEAIMALVAEKAPDARVSPNFNVIVATYTDAGSVKGTIKIIADGYDSKTITVDEVIAVLEKTDEMLLEEAVAATETAIKDIATVDGITKDVVTKAIANEDVTVTVKSEETKAPTTTEKGVQTVTITLKLGTLTDTVTKTFDIDMLEEEEEIPPTSDGTVLWSGSTDLGTDWGTSISVKFDTSKLKAGDTVKVTYKAGTAATYQQIKLTNGDWTVLESPTGMNEWDAIDLSASGTTYEFVISEADVKLLNGSMIVSGYNATISSIEVVSAKSEPASGYTDPENTTIPEGKTVTQKTAVEDGVYSQRFIKKVFAKDLVGVTKIVFTVSNGTKTATYESTKCYSSLNVNGGSLSAGDDYVFLGLTIKDIPENITVTIEDIEIVY